MKLHWQISVFFDLDPRLDLDLRLLLDDFLLDNGLALHVDTIDALRRRARFHLDNDRLCHVYIWYLPSTLILDLLFVREPLRLESTLLSSFLLAPLLKSALLRLLSPGRLVEDGCHSLLFLAESDETINEPLRSASSHEFCIFISQRTVKDAGVSQRHLPAVSLWTIVMSAAIR